MFSDAIVTVITLALGAIMMGVLYAGGLKVIEKETRQREAAETLRRLRSTF
jgi:2-keto-3-deoxy-6-phosphogluconate aldolase